MLSHRIGFEHTTTWRESARDAVVAYAMGILASAVILMLLGVMTLDMPPRQWVSMVGIQAVPASIGTLLGRSQLRMADPTAADVGVDAHLSADREKVEEAPVTMDYVPGHSASRGGLLFSRNPADFEMQIRATGYRKP